MQILMYVCLQNVVKWKFRVTGNDKYLKIKLFICCLFSPFCDFACWSLLFLLNTHTDSFCSLFFCSAFLFYILTLDILVFVILSS